FVTVDVDCLTEPSVCGVGRVGEGRSMGRAVGPGLPLEKRADETSDFQLKPGITGRDRIVEVERDSASRHACLEPLGRVVPAHPTTSRACWATEDSASTHAAGAADTFVSPGTSAGAADQAARGSRIARSNASTICGSNW